MRGGFQSLVQHVCLSSPRRKLPTYLVDGRDETSRGRLDGKFIPTTARLTHFTRALQFRPIPIMLQRGMYLALVFYLSQELCALDLHRTERQAPEPAV